MKKESSLLDTIARQLTQIVIAVKNGYWLGDSITTKEVYGYQAIVTEDEVKLSYPLYCLEKEKAIHIARFKPYGGITTRGYTPSRYEYNQDAIALTEKGYEIWKYFVWEEFYSCHEGPGGHSVIQRWNITPQMAAVAILGTRKCKDDIYFADILERISALDYLSRLCLNAA
ncbi:hypothetical protein KO465_07270 [Candidatus Micrarchaeota archaeon]|jgi:hypothetical protein|nr:hypothetical protein [Candidatus Micrarchaeota archaeon]